MNIRGVLATVAFIVAQPALAAPLEHRPTGLAASSANAGMQITALTDSIIRVRIAQGGKLTPDEQGVIELAAIELLSKIRSEQETS